MPGLPMSYVELRVAARSLELQLERTPADANVWSMASDAYHQLSRINVSFLPRVIECCRAGLRLLPEGMHAEPAAAQLWTNLAKVLGEAGHHDEAVDATVRACRIQPTFHNHYQHAEALLSAKRHAEAQGAYRSLVARRDAATRAPAALADVHNHLAVSLLETARSSQGASTGQLDEALEAVRSALRLHPACTHAHAHNYYQVLAATLHARYGIEYATAALWPVAAMERGAQAVAASAAYAAGGFQVLARAQQAAGDVDASRATMELLHSLGGAFSEACVQPEPPSTSHPATPPPPPLPASPSPSPPPPPPSGAIVYLCCADEGEIADLHRSLRLLFLHFNGRARYPVVIFHDLLDERQTEALQAEARAATAEATAAPPSGAAASSSSSTADAATVAADVNATTAASHQPPLQFEWLDESVFDFPSHMTDAQRAAAPRRVRGYGLGYRHMCRFFSGPVFEHAALAPYEYVWRLDSDSFLLAPPLRDPFAEMAAAGASYGWLHAYRDEDAFVTGLWETTRRFLRDEGGGIDEAAVHAWVPGGHTWPETPMCFATNCFLARRSWFTSPAYRRYFDALDRAGGFYAYRWGDACVHMLAVAALLPRSSVLRLTSLAYWHQGTVILPQAQREAGRALIGGLPEPVFAASVG